MHDGNELSLITPGTVVAGKYRVEELLDRGGFGSIFRAVQLDLGRDVALKVLHPRCLEQDNALDRFRREAQLAQALEHPNTVRLYDFGQTKDGLPFIAWQLLKGRSLGALLRTDGPLDIPRVAHITAQVLMALMEAHKMGIVHRDIKHANIFLAEFEGRANFVKVLDFGIAKPITKPGADITALTQFGQVVGTPRYVSPEQVREGKVTPASDLYAVGIVMAEMITARPVYEDMTEIEILLAHASNRPVPLPERATHSILGPVITKATHKDLSVRYETAAQMLGHIKRIFGNDQMSSSGANWSQSIMVEEGANRLSVPGLPKRSASILPLDDSSGILPLEDSSSEDIATTVDVHPLSGAMGALGPSAGSYRENEPVDSAWVESSGEFLEYSDDDDEPTAVARSGVFSEDDGASLIPASPQALPVQPAQSHAQAQPETAAATDLPREPNGATGLADPSPSVFPAYEEPDTEGRGLKIAVFVVVGLLVFFFAAAGSAGVAWWYSRRDMETSSNTMEADQLRGTQPSTADAGGVLASLTPQQVVSRLQGAGWQVVTTTGPDQQTSFPGHTWTLSHHTPPSTAMVSLLDFHHEAQATAISQMDSPDHANRRDGRRVLQVQSASGMDPQQIIATILGASPPQSTNAPTLADASPAGLTAGILQRRLEASGWGQVAPPRTRTAPGYENTALTFSRGESFCSVVFVQCQTVESCASQASALGQNYATAVEGTTLLAAHVTGGGPTNEQMLAVLLDRER